MHTAKEDQLAYDWLAYRGPQSLTDVSKAVSLFVP